jgi:hypothetical protein
MNARRPFTTLSAQSILIVALFTAIFAGACRDGAEEAEESTKAQAGKQPAEISVENGQTVLTLDSPTQKRLGLEVASLAPAVTREQTMAPAVVLSTQDLATFRNGYLATQSQLQKSRIEAGVARKEYARLKLLFDEDKNVSEKALQSAQGTLQTTESDTRAMEQQLSLQESVVRQEWGGVVSKWAVEGSPELHRLLDQREMLVQVTLPATTAFGPPPAISIEIPSGKRTGARFVSLLPRVDPRIQGESFLYLAPAFSGLSPGTNLVAHLSSGKPMRGVIAPATAIVWSEGQAWVYQQTAADRFTRRSIAANMPVEKGFFISSGLSAGDKVVTQGAQALLSEELLVHGQQGAEPDVD